MISLTNYKLIYKTISIVSFFLYIIFIYFFIIHSYNLYIKNKYLLLNFLNLYSKDDNKNLIYQIAISQGYILGYFILEIFILYVLKYLIFSLPISKKIISYWESQNEITPILGRFIVTEYRYNKYINTYTLIHLINLEQKQNYMLSYHEDINHLFKKYDQYYLNDKNNLK